MVLFRATLKCFFLIKSCHLFESQSILNKLYAHFIYFIQDNTLNDPPQWRNKVENSTQQMIADYVFQNGKIYTLNEKLPITEALAIKGDTIIYVGSGSGVSALIGPKTIVKDIKGKLLFPGFIDAHTHPALGITMFSGFVIEPGWDIPTIQKMLKKYVEAHAEKDYIFGFGYDNGLFGPNGPDKKYLDEVVPDKPLLLIAMDGHAAWVNSATLKLAGIDRNYPDPDPGFSFYVRDENGNPTGAAVEPAAYSELFNNYGFISIEDVLATAEQTLALFASYGITSFGDAGMIKQMGRDKVFTSFLEMEKQGKFLQRLVGSHMLIHENDISDALNQLKMLKETFHSPLFNINTMKFLVDGTMEVHSAALFDPYPDAPETSGKLVFKGQKLYDFGVEVAKKGYDLHLHGIGDKAINEILNMAEAVRKAGYHNTKITCAHTQLVLDSDMPRFKELDVIVNSSGFWHGYSLPTDTSLLGKVRAAKQWRFKSLIDQGVRVTLGSDFPATDFGTLAVKPLLGIQVAFQRRYPNTDDFADFPEEYKTIVGPPESERLDLEMAIKAYTLDAAYQLSIDDKVGSLEVGKKADLVLLDQDIFSMQEDDSMYKVKTLLTMMNGRITYNDL